MSTELSISVTDSHAKAIEKAVQSGEYASASEVVRDAMRAWKINQKLGQAWDEGIASGRADPQKSIQDLKGEAKRRSRRSCDAAVSDPSRR